MSTASASDHSDSLAPASASVAVGDLVSVVSVRSEVLLNGTIRFVGPTSFEGGVWIGVELDEPGKLCPSPV